MHQAVEQRLAPEFLARQQPRHRDAERQGGERRDNGDAQREPDGDPFVGGEIKHSAVALIKGRHLTR